MINRSERLASIWREGDWYVSQCVEVDVASRRKTKADALANLKEALELSLNRRTR